MIGIYCILNVFDDKIYIGQSRNIEKRIREHISALTASRHHNTHLQRAFNKYGRDNFVFSPMLECDEDKLDFFEVKYISDFDSTKPNKGYNLDSGGNKNKIRSEETVRKQRESVKGENNYSYGTGLLDKRGGVPFLKSEISKGNTQRAIAKKAGVHSSTLIGYLKVRNLSWSDLGGISKRGRRLGNSVLDKTGGMPFLKSEIRNGKSQRQISREAGVACGTLWNYIKTRGYTWNELKEEALSEME